MKMTSSVELVVNDELLGIIWESIRRYTIDKRIQSNEEFSSLVSELMKNSPKWVKAGSNIYPIISLLLTPTSESKSISQEIKINSSSNTLSNSITDHSNTLRVPTESIQDRCLNTLRPQESKSSSMVMIYTDGACSGNPGPGGYAARIIYENGKIVEDSKPLSSTTNNIAELKAIELGLTVFMNSASAVTTINILTDSQYVIGVLDKNWKAKANVELITSIRELLSKLRSHYTIIFTKVEGHKGNPNNERVDYLATHAVPRN